MLTLDLVADRRASMARSGTRPSCKNDFEGFGTSLPRSLSCEGGRMPFVGSLMFQNSPSFYHGFSTE